ncbi:MAG: sulfotransferase [Pseudomonadota bacterium]|nr:sulfotransferase [Pseudomonadota bacterium]
MSDKNQGGLSIHPYIGGSAANLVRSVIRNGGVSRGRIPTLALTLLGTAATFPIRLLESALYRRSVASTRVEQDPIFIIGHWRSGTTHLHNVISQDRRLGYLSTLQAIFPTCSVILSRNKTLKKLVAGLLPDQRMMDNMKMGVDLPQEEEFSLSCLTTASHHCNHFPSTILRSFERYVLLDTDDDDREKWKKTYRDVIRKTSYMAGGRRLVLKNPYNTARIKVLLEMFPNAKFIHIHRNPYNIYVSALHDFIKEAEEMALQDFTAEQFSELCYVLYEKLMRRYWETRDLVPKGNLVEVPYEDFHRAPLAQVERIYRELNLDLDEAARSDMSAYLESISDYRKNRYTFSTQQAEAIRNRWGFAIQKMNYSLPPDILVDEVHDWSCSMSY